MATAHLYNFSQSKQIFQPILTLCTDPLLNFSSQTYASNMMIISLQKYQVGEVINTQVTKKPILNTDGALAQDLHQNNQNSTFSLTFSIPCHFNQFKTTKSFSPLANINLISSYHTILFKLPLNKIQEKIQILKTSNMGNMHHIVIIA